MVVPPNPVVSAAGVLVVGVARAAWLGPDGELEDLSHGEAARRAQSDPPILAHAPASAARLGVRRFRALDVLELFAFACPAQFCVPTPAGLAAALALPAPDGVAGDGIEAEAAALFAVTGALLARVRHDSADAEAVRIARALDAAGWLWGPAVLGALGAAAGGASRLDIFRRLPEWTEQPPPPRPGDDPVSPAEALRRLDQMLGPDAEARPSQREYTAEAAAVFAPRDTAGQPHVVLAEAGTGTGKTLGYLAPASLWAQKNGAAVWVSTYTRNLQRQIDAELDRLHPDPARKRTRVVVRKRAKVVVRKGRENYLCLLNLEEATSRATLAGGIGAGLVARWALASKTGDMNGDFPGWLVGLVGPESTVQLTDRRGECIHAACAHYRRCFIEHAQRKARRADLVIANHALVMITAARADERRELPTRFVFDEGHHVFDAADSAFSAHLTAAEAAELRRWVRGPEGGRRVRGRGLFQRVGDLAAGSEAAEAALDDATRAAAALPAPGWLGRLRAPTAAGPAPAAETFFARVRDHVLARQSGPDTAYSLEATVTEPAAALRGAATAFRAALDRLTAPLQALARTLAARLDDDLAELEPDSRRRIEAACRGLARRAAEVDIWGAMLAALDDGTPEGFVDWFSLHRAMGRETDAGLHRHHLDPTVPFSETVLSGAHGALITSASLRDHTAPEDGDDPAGESWLAAEVRTGAHHLAAPPRRVSVGSPFDYGRDTRIFIVKDLARDNADAVAAAVRELFLAAGGSAIGLFTAISRLRGVHRRIAAPLAAAGLPLLAQHVDAMDTGTLVDIFRADIRACLLGTDAVRDGVDVPGRSLRLIVFDRVPWPRPDILHQARKKAFGGAAFEDRIARLRLRQAFGRLLRRAGDHGVFVMLDSRTPSRLLSAFPPGTAPERLGIAATIDAARTFLRDRESLAGTESVP